MPELPEYRFPLSRKRRWPLYAGIAFFVGFPGLLLLGGVFAGDAALLTSAGIIALLLLPFAIYLGLSLYRPVLLLSSRGIFLRGLGGAGEIEVSWDQIDSLALEVGAEGLVLKAPLRGKFTQRLRNWSGVRINGAALTPTQNLEHIAEYRFVPIAGFAAWFEEGRLREAFAAHAPHLLADFEARRQAAREFKPGNWKTLVWVLGLVGAYLVGVVWFATADIQLSEGWALAWHWLWRCIYVLLALGLTVVVWSNLRSAWRFLGERQWGPAFLWLAAGVMQGLIVLVALAQALA